MIKFDLPENPKKTGIATDFDGTISKIRQNQAEAIIDEQAKELLLKLSNCYRTVSIISGRPVKQLAQTVDIKGVFYIGNHGAEYLHNSHYQLLQEAIDVEPVIAKIYSEQKNKYSEFDFDYKKYSLAIHYRRHKHPEEAEKKIKELLEKYLTPQLKIQKGRMVYDIGPKNINKGLAINRLVNKYELEYFLYVGDDRTDIDAFKQMKNLEAKGIRTIKIALLSKEAPKGLVENSDIQIESLAQLNSLFRELLKQC
ncbi:MAG: trehalose-phosphatase [Actinobacteria bacterium]|nr:MAG: trehalose-phosphatase [Actinomycetota bacterium]